MSSIHEYWAEKHPVSQRSLCTDKKTVRVSEVAKTNNGAAATWTSNTRDLSWIELRSKLHGSPTPPEDCEQKIVLRAIWITQLSKPQAYDVEAQLLDSILKAVGQDELHRAGSSMLAGIECVKSGTSRKYLLNFQPKLSMTWGRSGSSNCTTMVCIAEETKLRSMEDMLSQEFVHRVSGHIMVPAILAVILFCTEVDVTQEKLKEDIRRVEVRTGHHDWKTRVETPALGDLVGIAAHMSGCSNRAASGLRKQRTSSEILSLTVEHCNSTAEDDETIIDLTRCLRTRVTAQQIDMDFIGHRNRTQLEALYHLVAQNDASSAQEMAQDTRLVAMAAQRDSASMKGIAILTMFFLPGTFVTSLLSIPLFDWDADATADVFRASRTRRILLVFAAITLPMMATVFVVWVLWTFWQTTAARRKIALAQSQLQNQQLSDELRLLLSKREMLTGLAKPTS